MGPVGSPPAAFFSSSFHLCTEAQTPVFQVAHLWCEGARREVRFSVSQVFEGWLHACYCSSAARCVRRLAAHHPPQWALRPSSVFSRCVISSGKVLHLPSVATLLEHLATIFARPKLSHAAQRLFPGVLLPVDVGCDGRSVYPEPICSKFCLHRVAAPGPAVPSFEFSAGTYPPQLLRCQCPRLVNLPSICFFSERNSCFFVRAAFLSNSDRH